MASDITYRKKDLYSKSLIFSTLSTFLNDINFTKFLRIKVSSVGKAESCKSERILVAQALTVDTNAEMYNPLQPQRKKRRK